MVHSASFFPVGLFPVGRLAVSRRITSNIPPPNPSKPKIKVKTGEVPRRPSSRYPSPAAITMLPTSTKGRSMTFASWRTNPSGSSRGGDGGGCESRFLSGKECGRQGQRISCQTDKRFRIDASNHGDEAHHRQRDRLSGRYPRPRLAGGFAQPGVHNDSEIIIKRGNNIQSAKQRQIIMARLDQGEKDVIFPHKAGQRRNSRKRKHKDEQQQRRCGAALEKAVQVVEFVPDQSLPPQHNDDGKGSDGHEGIDKKIEGNALQPRFVSIWPAHRR